MRRQQHASGDRETAECAEKSKKDPSFSPKSAASDPANMARTAAAAAPHASGEKVGGPEFGGPVGAAVLTLGLPLLVLYITACTEDNWNLFAVPTFSARNYIDGRAFLLVLAWYILQAAIYMLPVGRLVRGAALKDGSHLEYSCNGFIALLVSLAVFGTLVYCRYPVDVYVAQHIPQLTVASIFWATAVSVLVYMRALGAPDTALAPSATGNHAYDFYMGRELNPRVMSFDLKFFFELRPGLIGWVMINLCLVSVQCSQNGGLPNASLCLVTAFQLIYVVDALWSEPAVLTTFDILHEGFGFMLAFGDLVWVPFLYTLQSRFVFTHPLVAVTDVYALTAIALLNLCGLLIFRAANNQKNEFRSSPNDSRMANLESIPTAYPGKRLLVGGWWGMCRRPNYLGDLLMSLAWCLPCGFTHLLPYFYPAYFFVLLVHRQRRDEEHCLRRYGDAWAEYCRRVPYKIIPYVF